MSLGKQRTDVNCDHQGHPEGPETPNIPKPQVSRVPGVASKCRFSLVKTPVGDRRDQGGHEQRQKRKGGRN
jgi:hypothetical protein